jgi:hypothetical protein
MTDSIDILQKCFFGPDFLMILVTILGIMNLIIFVFRLTLYIREKQKDNNFKFNYELLSFVVWLQLQIMAFYVLLSSFYSILLIVYYLLNILKEWIISLFSKRTTNWLMKMMGLIITDNVAFRLFCLFVIGCLLFIIYLIISRYYSLVYFLTVLLIGYTKI